jgi:hypothetical protein
MAFLAILMPLVCFLKIYIRRFARYGGFFKPIAHCVMHTIFYFCFLKNRFIVRFRTPTAKIGQNVNFPNFVFTIQLYLHVTRFCTNT